MGLEYDRIRDCSGGFEYYKANYRGVHNCYKCNALLSIEKYEKIIYFSKVDKLSGGTKYIWDVFYCPNCLEYIEFKTQLTYEDINIFISKVKRKFFKKGITLQVRKCFETKEGELIDKIKNIEDIQNLCLLFRFDSKVILEYKNPIIKKEMFRKLAYSAPYPYYYFKFSKSQIMKDLKAKLNK